MWGNKRQRSPKKENAVNGTDARGLPSWMMPADLCDPFGFLSWPFRQFYFCLFRSTTFQNDYNYCYFTLFFSVFFSLIYNSRRRSPRLSFVLWKCRRKWRATRSAWLWLPPIVSTFSRGRRVKSRNGGSTSSPCSPGLIWRCVLLILWWEIGRVIDRFLFSFSFFFQTGRHKRNATFPGSKATTIILTQQQHQQHQQSTAPNSPCLSKGNFVYVFFFGAILSLQ